MTSRPDKIMDRDIIDAQADRIAALEAEREALRAINWTLTTGALTQAERIAALEAQLSGERGDEGR